MAVYFGYSPGTDTTLTERTALGLSAFYRAGALISGTVAALPLHTYRTQADGQRDIVPSWLDDPGAPVDMTAFEWKEMIMWHLFLGGDAFLYHLYNGAGSMAGAQPIHPRSVTVDWIRPEHIDRGLVGRKVFSIMLEDGTLVNDLDSRSITQIMGPSLDGLRGMSVISLARTSLGGAVAGDRAAKKMFENGAMQSAIATPDEDLEEGEAEAIQRDIDDKSGVDNAARMIVVNRRLKITPWSMSAVDAEYLEQRKFGIEEVSRWTGVPPHLLMQTDKQTSWGTGVAEQNLGLRQYNLIGYTGRTEARLDRLTPRGQESRFDYAELERPSPKDETGLAIQKYQGGLATRNEGRLTVGLPKVSGGDVFFGEATAPAPQDNRTQIEDGSVA